MSDRTTCLAREPVDRAHPNFFQLAWCSLGAPFSERERFTDTAADAAPTDRVIGLSPLQIQRRFTAAARAAGIEARVTAHSGRVGLASELTARGASTTEVMLAGNWKTARMVAHYSAGATAERGAVARYL